MNLCIFAIAILALSLTGSRSAFGGFWMGLFVVFILAGKRYVHYIIAFLIVGLVAFNSFFANSPVFSRTGTVSEDLQFRQSIWIDAFQIAKENPYLGIGWGNYQNYIMRHKQDQYLVINDEILYFDQPENGYLKVLVELGFVGFAIFLVFVIKPLINGITLFLKNTADYKIVFLIASLVSWVVAFNTVYSLFDERILIMVVTILALLIAVPEKMDLKYERD